MILLEVPRVVKFLGTENRRVVVGEEGAEGGEGE